MREQVGAQVRDHPFAESHHKVVARPEAIASTATTTSMAMK